MIYHFRDCEYKEVFQRNQYPVIDHVSRLEMRSGQSYQAMHSHKGRVEILYILEGEGRHIIGNKTYDTQEGDLIIFNADTPHEEKVRGEKTLHYCCCAVRELKVKGRKENHLIADGQVPVIRCKKIRGGLLHSMRFFWRRVFQARDCLQRFAGILRQPWL